MRTNSRFFSFLTSFESSLTSFVSCNSASVVFGVLVVLVVFGGMGIELFVAVII